MFSYREERYDGEALSLTYHFTPWDEPVLGKTAAISAIAVRKEADAAGSFKAFRDWAIRNEIRLVSCRLPQKQMMECGFLEQQGFRFIELNYRPTIAGLDAFSGEPEIAILPAALSDSEEIVAIAGNIFDTGRLHVDPNIGRDLGNRRYALWAANAFRDPAQTVFRCMFAGRIAAFFVVEKPTGTSRFWSLVGLAPGLAGRGLGRRVWTAMLAAHHGEGVGEVSTSISSHNVSAHNLYVSLGFRFPAPDITLHWCPFGPLTGPAR